MNFKSRHTLLGISAIFLCFLKITSGGYASLNNNAYTNVVVAISQDIPTDTSLDEAIQDLFERTSEILYNATGHRAYFGDITIIGPKSFLNSNSRAKRGVGSQWQSPTPSFDSADIRIDLANVAYDDVPYTQQSRGCGEPGDFIHLTPAFVKNTNDPWSSAKLLANEWIKYRYGVFDENGYNWNEVYPVMYYGTRGQKDYNICSNNTQVVWKTEKCSDPSNDVIGLDQACTLEPDTNGLNTNVNSSMMSKPILQLATQYCSNSSDHNSDAPNKQNFNCAGKSVMEVVLEHADFTTGKNNARNEDFGSLSSMVVNKFDTNENIGLVIVSDLMDINATAYSTTPSTMKFITLDFPTNSYFGFIQNLPNDEGDKYTTISKFVQISSNQTRKGVSDDIPLNLVHNTSMPYSRENMVTTVQVAIDLLNTIDNTFNKGILLISDQLTFGSTSDDLATICANANSSKIQLHLITFNGALFNAFNSFGGCPGQVYLIQAAAQSSAQNELTVCYADMQRRAQMENALMNLPSTMLPDKFDRPTVFFEQMYTNTVSNGTFFVDADVVSGETAFYVETCSNEIYHNTPMGQLLDCRVSNGSSVKYVFEGKAFIDTSTINASGSYNFRVENMLAKQGQVPYVVYAVGKPFGRSSSNRQKTSVLNTQAWAIAEDTNSQYTKVRIFASVKNGTTPIFNANVTATIISSTGSPKNYTVTLRDDGSGNPDISAQDGIYSAYFTQFVGSAYTQYSVNVLITDNNGVASYPTAAYPWISNENDMHLQNCRSFQRKAQTNAFTARGTSSAIPPGTVTDFRIQSIDGSDISLTWTAPGDDLDYGKAADYVFNCHTNKTYLQSLDKLDGPGVPIDSNIPSKTPQQAGSTEKVIFTGSYDQTVHYCAMQAVDGSNPKKYGEVSNLISYYLISDSPAGLNSASIAGIVVGVILGIILLIAIIVLIWWCLAGKDEKQEKRPDPADPEQNAESTKLKPITPQAPIAVDQRSNVFATEAMQKNHNSRPSSMHSLAHSNDGNGSDEDDARSNYSKHTNGMQTFQQGAPYGIPVLPSQDFQMQPMGGNRYGSPGQDTGEEYDSTQLMANADVAVPQLLTRLARIEDVGEYHDKNILKGTPNTRDEIQDYRNLPVYNHMLNKPGPPLPPPRSASSSQSSLSNIGNPKSISQV